MSGHHLLVREIQPADIGLITDYWLQADSTYLAGMGVDIHRLPSREQFTQWITSQLEAPIEQKKSYCIIWEADGRPVGHSNTNPTIFGEEASMHLHLWDSSMRKMGLGSQLLSLTLPWYFEKLQLKRLISEPYALNPAPHKALEKAGFTFVKEYITTPGSLNYEQPVKQWMVTREQFAQLHK